MRFSPRLARKPAYVLWLLRDEGVEDWATLCLHFGWDPADQHSGHFFLEESLERLERAGLISRDGPRGRIAVTDVLPRVQAALGISVKDLALQDDDTIVATPIFGKPSKGTYGSDLFVLMPFAEHLKPVYEDHIKSVAKRLSMTVARADDFFTAESIMEEVWAAIYHSKFMLADCTGRNPNVFYEIGLAHTLGKPVVLITQDENDVPFDLRHRRYIKYAYTPRGMEAFENQLSATLSAIGKGA